MCLPLPPPPNQPNPCVLVAYLENTHSVSVCNRSSSSKFASASPKSFSHTSSSFTLTAKFLFSSDFPIPPSSSTPLLQLLFSQPLSSPTPSPLHQTARFRRKTYILSSGKIHPTMSYNRGKTTSSKTVFGIIEVGRGGGKNFTFKSDKLFFRFRGF